MGGINVFKKNDFTPFDLKLLLNSIVPEERSKSHQAVDFYPGWMGRYTAWEGKEKGSDGKEYPYVGYYDKWNNPATDWLGGKSPELAGRIYYDPQTRKPLTPQPILGVEQDYKNYIDSVNTDYIKNKEFGDAKYKPSFLGKLFGAGMAPGTDIPANVAMYYARKPRGYGINWDDIKNTWAAIPTWGKTYNELHDFDTALPGRAELYAMQLGVGANYRKQHFENRKLHPDEYLTTNVTHTKPILRASYYKPLGHTGNMDFPFYLQIPEETNDLFLSNYFSQKRIPDSNKELNDAWLFEKLTNTDNGLGLDKYRPAHFEKLPKAGEGIDVWSRPYGNNKSFKDKDYISFDDYLEYIESDPNEDFGKHWYSPKRIGLFTLLAGAGVLGYPKGIIARLAENEKKAMLTKQQEANRQYVDYPWNLKELKSDKRLGLKVNHYFE